MKSYIKCIIAVLAAITGISANAAFTYNPNDNTLTGGGWTFTVTRDNNITDELRVVGTNGSFDKEAGECKIDLTTITDSDGNFYKAVSFSGVPADGAELTEFIAPECKQISSFEGKSKLKKVELNPLVSYFPQKAFKDCAALEEFSPRNLKVESIEANCFSGCSSLGGEFILEECTSLGISAFSGCKKITSVKIPKVTSIGTSAFSSCSSLETVITSEALKKIPMAAFSGCESLSGDSIRKMLHSGITHLGDTYAKFGQFSGCSNFDGELIWNFPSLASTNIVGQDTFYNCIKLEKVIFKTPVLKTFKYALVNLAPGAEIYFHDTPPVTIMAQSIGNISEPFSKVYLNEKNMIEGLAKIAEGYHVLLKKDFNNSKWTDYANKSLRTRDQLVEFYMKRDTSMCQYDEEKKEVELSCPEQREVIAFCVPRVSGAFQTNWPAFWLMKTPKRGFSVIVR